MGSRRGVALALVSRAVALLGLQRSVEARPLLAEGLEAFRAIGDRPGVAGTLEALAHLEHQEGHTPLAARRLGASAALRESGGIPLTPSEQPDHDRLVEALRRALGESAFAHHWEAGRVPAWEQVVAEALGMKRF